jgi:hypothetical protein
MASPSSDMDIGAQSVSITETQPAIIPNSPTVTYSANSQLPTTADTQPQATNINERYNGNAPTIQAVDHSGAQNGT